MIEAALTQTRVAKGLVDRVYMGCVLQACLGQNTVRQATLKAGLPRDTPATHGQRGLRHGCRLPGQGQVIHFGLIIVSPKQVKIQNWKEILT